MGHELQRLKRRKATIQRMEQLFENRVTTLVIHYSCESFYNKTDGKTPRITSIAVRNFDSGQTESFSIHQIAEKQKIEFSEITNHYDELEKQMLEHFFEFVKIKQHCHWIHWNMRDVNYGFTAIEHRFRVLGGTPVVILEDKKFDLSRELINLYGVAYIGHPRFESIIKKNNITDKDFLNGEKEAEAFNQKEFVKLHQSTLRKVDSLANIFERALNDELKTNASWFMQRGYSFAVLIERIKQHWIFSLLTIISLLLGLFLRIGQFF